MMHLFKKLTLLPLLACLTACVQPVPPDVLQHANYGPRPPSNYQALAKKDLSYALIDPTSPLFRFSAPVKGYTRQDQALNNKLTFGWLVCGEINSKNRMGGYTGWVPFFVLFDHGQIAQTEIGEADNDISVMNAEINNVCSRGNHS